MFSVLSVFLRYSAHTQAAAPGALNTFLDEGCEEASIINPSVNLPVDTCLVTPGALGISVQVLPPCSSGQASFIMYSDKACRRAESMDLQFNNCYFDSQVSINAVQFVCTGVAGGSIPTATTTITFGSSTIPVAGGGAAVATAAGGESHQSSPSVNTADVTSTPSSTASSSSNPSSTSNNDHGNDSSSGLSPKSQIALGVGIPVATLLVALLAWWFPCRKVRQYRHDNHSNYVQQRPGALPPHFPPPPSNHPPQELPTPNIYSSYQPGPGSPSPYSQRGKYY
ncbi:MAG: hypothetical protein Q9170_005574 [Blastenia crenularia]